jgi:hypothetical protein
MLLSSRALTSVLGMTQVARFYISVFPICQPGDFVCYAHHCELPFSAHWYPIEISRVQKAFSFRVTIAFIANFKKGHFGFDETASQLLTKTTEVLERFHWYNEKDRAYERQNASRSTK